MVVGVASGAGRFGVCMVVGAAMGWGRDSWAGEGLGPEWTFCLSGEGGSFEDRGMFVRVNHLIEL